ncbi:MAG: hypothetical protein WD066_18035 [Planctomycetaceae bacterium]
MSASTLDRLEVSIRDAGEGWLLDYFVPREKALPHIRGVLAAIEREAHEKGVAPFDEEVMLNELERNPHRVRAFFQLLGGTRTPAMLLMAWRVMLGMEVRSAKLSYERAKAFHFEVVLVSPYGDPPEAYSSENVNDLAILRHFGVTQIGGKPIIDGFYPLRTR